MASLCRNWRGDFAVQISLAFSRRYVDFEPFFADTDEFEVPVFDKRIAHAARDHVVLHEAMRTWPGALRSDHPDTGVVAIGKCTVDRR